MKLLTTLLVGLVSTSFGNVSVHAESYVLTSTDIICANLRTFLPLQWVHIRISKDSVESTVLKSLGFATL